MYGRVETKCEEPRGKNETKKTTASLRKSRPSRVHTPKTWIENTDYQKAEQLHTWTKTLLLLLLARNLSCRNLGVLLRNCNVPRQQNENANKIASSVCRNCHYVCIHRSSGSVVRPAFGWWITELHLSRISYMEIQLVEFKAIFCQ